MHLGVDRGRLPEVWRESLDHEFERPIEERQYYSLLWLIDDETVGFASTDRLRFGDQAFMHLHIVEPLRRNRGYGMRFVRRSAQIFFETLDLQRPFCEPNALNVAPNRTVQAASATCSRTRPFLVRSTSRRSLLRGAIQVPIFSLPKL